MRNIQTYIKIPIIHRNNNQLFAQITTSINQSNGSKENIKNPNKPKKQFREEVKISFSRKEITSSASMLITNELLQNLKLTVKHILRP